MQQDSFQSDFGKRLKQERERLGFSQASFAEKVGVHRNTQVRYETGVREPDADYLVKIQELGVDSGFLFFGARTNVNSIYSLAATRVLPAVAERAGLLKSALFDVLEIVAEDEAACWSGNNYAALDEKELLDALFEDSVLLGGLFIGIARCLHEQGVSLPYGKRAQVLLMLYRTFKANGKVDPAMIEEAVKLAVG